jgi:hypothetical protein
MRSPWSAYESAPVPHSDTWGVTIDNDHLCFPFPVRGRLDEVEIYGEQHDVGGYPAAGRWRVGAQTRCLCSPRSMDFRTEGEV